MSKFIEIVHAIQMMIKFMLYMSIVNECLTKKKKNIIKKIFDLLDANVYPIYTDIQSMKTDLIPSRASVSACTSWLYSEFVSNCY